MPNVPTLANVRFWKRKFVSKKMSDKDTNVFKMEGKK
jgi:hypothetical protein